MSYLRQTAAFWRDKQNIVVNKQTAASVKYIQQILKEIEETARREIVEKVLCNNLSAIELRLGTFDEDFREDVFKVFQQATLDDENGILVMKDKTKISLAHVNFDTCFEGLLWDMAPPETWLDRELPEGSIVTVNQFFGYMPRTTPPRDADLSTECPSPYAMFLGWKEETIESDSTSEMTQGRYDVLRTYTQHWLWDEKVYVQNLPRTCYAVIRSGADDGSAPKFWDPTQDFD